MVEVHQLTKRFEGPDNTITALQELSLSVEAGTFLAIQGASGSGKTTLLLAIGGLERPDEGTITVDGQDPYRLAPDARAIFRATHIGFVFQQYHLINYLTVLENVMTSMIATSRDDAAERARELVAHFGLGDRARHLPAALSAGERQRVALARALFNQPRLLLADEPTGNLDRQNAEAVLRHLAAFADSGGTVLLVTHDEQTAARAHRVAHLERGRLRPE